MALRRGRRSKNVRVTLGRQPKVVPAEAESDVGFHVQEITENIYRDQRLETREGAFVRFVERGSPASEAGLRPGDVVEQIERVDVDDLEAFRRAILATAERDRFLIRARRGPETKFLLVKRGAKPTTTEEPESDSDTAVLEPEGDEIPVDDATTGRPATP